MFDTPEAEIMVRAGDIDELGSASWPKSYTPFSGRSTPEHRYTNWKIDPADPPGTDRIMVVSSYRCRPPGGQDGYTNEAMHPSKRKTQASCEIPLEHQVTPIELKYSLNGRSVRSALLQIFVDDFQAPVWRTKYEVTLNRVRVPALESIINSLNQTAPVGKLITFPVPQELLSLVGSERLELKIDDSTTGAGDGYAISFVKLLINQKQLANLGKIVGQVTDMGRQPIPSVTIKLNGQDLTKTDATGRFSIDRVPAGLASLTLEAPGYKTAILNIDVISGKPPVTSTIKMDRLK